MKYDARARSYVFNLDTGLFGHEPKDGEDGQPAVEGGGAVDDGDEEGVAHAVVVELVERPHHDQRSHARTHRVENLGESKRKIIPRSTDFVRWGPISRATRTRSLAE